ncbi:MAG: mandelate racemase/muconate lactonizing enzyme family protein, partial [Rubrivivax sp.]
MTRIVAVELLQVDLPPPVPRSDAIQSFVTQETPFVRIECDDGSHGTGYSYTIGTGGSSVMALLHDHLAPQLIGRDPALIESIWRELMFSTHATSVGAITSLALAAIDTALWDWRCRRDGQPLWLAAGGAKQRIPVYTTEGGWLHLSPDDLVRETLAAQAAGFKGAKVKVGKPHVSEDVARLKAVRDAVGDGFEIMVDANQCFALSEAMRRAPRYAELGIAWFEEPLPADDITGHARLAAASEVPIAVGESLYSIGQFAAYVQHGAASILQVDVARIGGVTPWLKVAHLAESFNLAVCPHFLMELHVSLCAAVPSAAWVEY